MSSTDIYLDQVRQGIEADFLLLTEADKTTFVNLFALDDNRGRFNSASLSQLWSMEVFILRHISATDLLRRTWIIRERFRLSAGEAVYKNYLNTLPEPITEQALKQPVNEAALAMLRDDAVNLMRQMQRMNFFRMQRNLAINEKKKFPIQVFIALVTIGIAVFSLIDHSANGQSWQLILLMVHFGMIGAVISLIQRLEQASNVPPNFTDSASNAADIGEGMTKFYMVSLIVSGAVFSVLVYLLSRSQWLNIFDLLPKPLDAGNCMASSDFINKFLCAQFGPAETAKLLILSFISGFAERFVPDVLDSLIRRAPVVDNKKD